MPQWKLYDPSAQPAAKRVKLPKPPPWRQPGPQRLDEIASTFQATEEVVSAVNAALHLRRPLLITGNPGTGKTSLIFSVARQLGLGRVFTWSINSRSTLADGLYRYDALGRLQHIQQKQQSARLDLASAGARATSTSRSNAASAEHDIGMFISLGPLGSAVAAPDAPRALLIDEIDKSDVDLPNDLLSVLDTGSFPIVELQRMAQQAPKVDVRDSLGEKVTITDGTVSFKEYPFIVMTSNGERDFPAPFLRRCVQCSMPDPSESQLLTIVRAHLPTLKNEKKIKDLLAVFLERREQGALATDQLLNAQFLQALRATLPEPEQAQVLDVLFRNLNG